MDYLQLVPISIKNLQIQDSCIKELRDDIELMKQELQKLKDYMKLEEQTQTEGDVYVPSPTTSYDSSTISSEDFDNW